MIISYQFFKINYNAKHIQKHINVCMHITRLIFGVYEFNDKQ